jgi:CheY-like chemotaxis protein
MNILVVEDHADTRQALEMLLQVLGHRTRAARDAEGAVAIALATDQPFDLLISDLQLPDGDGWNLLRRLEAAARRPPQAIALSGWSSKDDVIKSRSAGFQAHLVKPTGPRDLEAAVAKASEAIQSAKT